MFRKLTYFNLIYGAGLFVLNYETNHRNLLTLFLIAVIIAFNWFALKKLEGLNILADRAYNVFRILTIMIGMLILINVIIVMIRDTDVWTQEIGGFTFVISVRIVFALTAIIHAITSYRLRLSN